MFEIIQAGGWFMLPIILCSIASVAIIAERFWALQTKKIIPKHLVAQIWNWHKKNELTIDSLRALRDGSPLGRVLAAGLVNRQNSRTVMKESIEDAGRHEVHDMERFLNTLGTIAAIAPLLGLLGSVIGLMEVFATMTSQGVGNPQALGSGISKIMIATAAGLVVAIPALIFYRHFQRRVDELAISMEQEAIKLVEVMMGERDQLEAKEAKAAKDSREIKK